MTARWPRCAHCGELIGVYEPMAVIMTDGTINLTSRLAFGDTRLDSERLLVLHKTCHEQKDTQAAAS